MEENSHRIEELERRVAFLESELGISYDEQKFKNTVSRIFDNSVTIEFRDGHFGYFARVQGIDGDDAQSALDELDNTAYGYALTETGSGLGIEIWTE